MRDIPRQQIIRRLREDNPWWETGTLPERFLAWRPRPYLRLFLAQVRERGLQRAVVLMGPRRVGKTVLLHHTFQQLLGEGTAGRLLCYISIDHPVYNGMGLEDLLAVYEEATGCDFRREPCVIAFDEVQYLKDWEVHLKALVDRYTTPKFVASGSAAAALRLKSLESGAGRFTDFLLPPLTFEEYLGLKGRESLVELPDEDSETDSFPTSEDLGDLNEEFVEYLNYGGYPEVVLNPVVRRSPATHIKSDIVDKVLLRDLPSLYGIQDIQELNSLFATLAYNTAGEVSLDALSKKSGVAKNTIKRYIEYLEAAFLIRRVHRVDRSGRKFRRANFFKVYLTNPSIRSALFSTVREGDDAVGALVETAVYAQWFHDSTALYYARWTGGEVDMVHLDPEGSPSWAVEVKWSNQTISAPEKIQNVVRFCRENDLHEALVTTRTVTDSQVLDGVKVEFVPAALACFAIGHNLLRGKGA